VKPMSPDADTIYTGGDIVTINDASRAPTSTQSWAR
jgi:hypothetical protein